MRILLADNQAKVRFALRVLLERQPRVEVIGEAANADELLDQVRKSCPDLLLLGWGLPGRPPAELPSSLRSICPNLTVIALSGRPEARAGALTAGADAFVSKVEPAEQLLAAVKSCCGQNPQPGSSPHPDGPS